MTSDSSLALPASRRPVRRALLFLIGTVLLLATWLRRRSRRSQQRAAPRSVDLPAALIRAVRAYEAVLLAGPSFVLPGTKAPTLFQCCKVVDPVVASVAANDIEEASADEAEMLLGEVCQAVGVGAVRRAATALWVAARRTAKGVNALVLRRVAAAAAVPFTAVLSSAWSEELEDYFPHRVGLNFGGFATVLSKPRVDAKPGKSRPAMQLWPALWGEGKDCEASLPLSRLECERAVGLDAPYVGFLRDVFGSKVVVLLGWPTIVPGGHIGAALRAAWTQARCKDRNRHHPLAYAVVAGGSPDTASHSAYLETHGVLCVDVADALGGGCRDAEEVFLRALSEQASGGE